VCVCVCVTIAEVFFDCLKTTNYAYISTAVCLVLSQFSPSLMIPNPVLFFVVFCFFQELNIIIVCGNNNGGFFYQTTTLFDNTLGISNIVRKIFVSISFEDILSNNQILIYESISFFSPRLMLTVSRVRYSQA